MLKHETKLIDPDADAIIAALTTAVVDANKRCRARLLKDDPAKWRKFARNAAAKPEGWEMFRGGKGGVPATQILAAWWTDSIGRKHIVIRGRRVEHDEAKRLLHKEDIDKRPPLMHAYPEYVCRRTVEKESQIVCACGCGAVGTPESLGWMGETCGPCFDRKEELGTAGLRGNFPGVLYSDRGPLGALACSPDGTRVAAVEGDNSVTYWDIATRTRTVTKFSGMRVMDVAITSDGRYLLAVGLEGVFTIHNGLFAAFDLNSDPPQRVDSISENTPLAWRIAALPDSNFALRHRIEWPTYAGYIELIRVPSGETVRGPSVATAALQRFAVSPDGKQFATASDPVRVYDVATMRQISEIRGMQSALAFSHDGTRVFAAYISTLKSYDIAGGKMLAEGWLVGSKKGNAYLAGDHITTLVVDPSGASVFAGTLQGRVFVFNANTLARRASFDWHLGSVSVLAISADGSRLFSSGGDGCVKVWPIRDLLRGL